VDVPVVNVSAPGAPRSSFDIEDSASKFRYAVVFLEASLQSSGPSTYGSWFALSYIPKGNNQPKFSFTNFGQQPVYVDLAHTGIVLNLPVPKDPACKYDPACKENEAFLQTLNLNGMPPPGSPSSPFKPLQYPPPQILQPTKPGG
jgi:hypothetical protein